MLNISVKASSITNLTDARYFAAWGVDWIGFNFNAGSDAYMAPQSMKEIRSWLEGPKVVGEFDLHSAEEIMEAAEFLELDMVQLGFLQPVETAQAINAIPLIKEIVVEDLTDFSIIEEQCSAFYDYVEAFVIDYSKNKISWTTIKEAHSHLILLQEYCQKFNIILSIDLAGSEINEVIEQLKPYGINVKGGAEEKVGYKSFDELDEIFEQLEYE